MNQQIIIQESRQLTGGRLGADRPPVLPQAAAREPGLFQAMFENQMADQALSAQSGLLAGFGQLPQPELAAPVLTQGPAEHRLVEKPSKVEEEKPKVSERPANEKREHRDLREARAEAAVVLPPVKPAKDIPSSQQPALASVEVATAGQKKLSDHNKKVGSEKPALASLPIEPRLTARPAGGAEKPLIPESGPNGRIQKAAQLPMAQVASGLEKADLAAGRLKEGIFASATVASVVTGQHALSSLKEGRTSRQAHAALAPLSRPAQAEAPDRKVFKLQKRQVMAVAAPVSRETISSNSKALRIQEQLNASGFELPQKSKAPAVQPLAARSRDEAVTAPVVGFAQASSVERMHAGRELVALASRANLSEQFEQMMLRARVQLRDDQNARFQTQLYPRELGRIALQMTLVDGVLQGRLVVENEAVQKELMQKMDVLAQQLRSEGFSVSGFQVDVNSGQAGDFKQGQSEPGRQGPVTALKVAVSSYEASQGKPGGLYA